MIEEPCILVTRNDGKEETTTLEKLKAEAAKKSGVFSYCCRSFYINDETIMAVAESLNYKEKDIVTDRPVEFFYSDVSGSYQNIMYYLMGMLSGKIHYQLGDYTFVELYEDDCDGMHRITVYNIINTTNKKAK